MTNATKSLAAIFIVLSLLTAVIKWSSGPEASEVFRSQLVSVDTSQVTRIVIEQPSGEPLTLEKDQQQWRVSSLSSEQPYPADGSRVRGAVSRLNDMNITAVATRDPGKFTRYRVDSTGIQVSLYGGDELFSSVYVGAPQSGGPQSFNNYVRLDRDDAVYAVDGLLESTFAGELEDWRDKTVWEVDQSHISQLSFSYPEDSSFVIDKAEGENQNWISGSDTLSYSSVSPLLRQLSSLRASGFADSLARDAFGTETYAIRLTLAGGGQHRLRLKESEADTTIYLGTTPDFPYVFSLEKEQWDEDVLKSRSELLNEDR